MLPLGDHQLPGPGHYYLIKMVLIPETQMKYMYYPVWRLN